MYDARRVNILESTQNLIQEVLDKLFLQRSRRQQSMEIGSKEFGDKIQIFKWRDEHIAKADNILVLYVLEELELTVCSLAQNWGTKGLHNLFDGNRRSSKLILGRADKAKCPHSDRLQIDIASSHLERGAKYA